MPYSITTKDGITINNIPDEVPPDDPSLKERVARARSGGGAPAPVDDERAKEQAALRTFRQGETAPMPKSTGEKVAGVAAQMIGAPGQFAEGMRGGLSNQLLGVRQFLANQGVVGDPEALRAEAESREMEARGRPPGFAKQSGELFGGVAPALLTGAGAAPMVAKGVSMLPKAAQFLSSLGTSAAGGAVQGLAVPESGEYNAGEKAQTGAAWGVGGNLVGRLAGRIMSPFRGVGDTTAQENAAIINSAGLPAQIPATQSNSPMIQAATNALEQVPGFGRLVTKAREANAGWVTKKMTAPVGDAVDELPPSVRAAMKDQLQADARSIANVRRATMQPQVPKDMEDPYRAVLKFASIEPGKPMSMEQLMAARSAATKLADSASSGATPRPEVAKDYRAIRELFDDRIKLNLPSANMRPPGTVATKEGFDDWLKRWGSFKDVEKAFEKGAPGGRLTAPNAAAALDDPFAPSGTNAPLKRVMNAAAENMPSPPAGWNRAMITSLLLGGAPAIGGVGSDLLRGDIGPGTTLGLGASGTLISGLAHKKLTPQQIDEMRRFVNAMLVAQQSPQSP